METLVKITGAQFDAMVARGAFDVETLGSKKVELIRGEIQIMNPAGPIHDDHIECLTDWSVRSTTRKICNVRIQCGFVCDDDRPEPDVLWLRPKRYGSTAPTTADVMLLIEVSDSSLKRDLQEKADLYSERGVAEYWVVDIPNRRIHVMTGLQDGRYRNIQIITPPTPLSPTCHGEAILNTAELFDVH